eukprot:3686474-Prymnesium_polylepis.1
MYAEQWPAELFDGSARSPGAIALTREAFVWTSSSDSERKITLKLVNIFAREWVVKNVSPFQRVHRLKVREPAAIHIFDLPFNLPTGQSGSGAQLHVEWAIEAAVKAAKSDVAAARTATTPTIPAAAPTAAAPAATPAAAPAGGTGRAAARKPTERVQEGRKLREQLLEINRLRKQGGAAEAAELASSLESEAPADAKKLDGLARQRVRELRDTAFSFGKLDLTREVVRRFVDMPEVRPLLTTEVIQRRRDALDGETARELIKAAKAFFSELLKAP